MTGEGLGARQIIVSNVIAGIHTIVCMDSPIYKGGDL